MQRRAVAREQGHALRLPWDAADPGSAWRAFVQRTVVVHSVAACLCTRCLQGGAHAQGLSSFRLPNVVWV